ncbi:MAG: hypothetical protein HY000_20070 [Planctomycetes bacterium]|nr:hypothetical protein [Planctomycetota bacterium]
MPHDAALRPDIFAPDREMIVTAHKRVRTDGGRVVQVHELPSGSKVGAPLGSSASWAVFQGDTVCVVNLNSIFFKNPIGGQTAAQPIRSHASTGFRDVQIRNNEIITEELDGTTRTWESDGTLKASSDQTLLGRGKRQ